MCIYPCKKVFAGEMDLVRHYSQRPACKISWEARLKRAIDLAAWNASMEANNHTTMLANQDQTTEMDGGNSIDDSGVQTAPNDDGNDDKGGIATPPAIPPTSNGTSAAGPGNQTVEDNGAPEFEDFLFGAGDDVHGLEEHVNPCLEEEDGDADESGSSHVFPIGTLVEELEEALENVQIDSEGDEELDLCEIESFTRAGEIKNRSKSHFESVLGDEQWSPFRPFGGAAEFQMAKWLNELPLSKVDSFLQLDWVNGNGGLSFGSGKGMRECIEKLAQPRMTWKSVEVLPRSGTTSSPVHLCYRDPVEAVRSLLDCLSLAKHMSYTPQRHWKNKAEGKRVYNEIFTGDWLWETQASLPLGSMVIPVLFGSDKAHLTDHSGDKSAWSLYLSIGNIHSSVHNKPSEKCWILITYIPIAAFSDPKALHTTLQARLFHQCLKIVVASLKDAGENGDIFVDSKGDQRWCYPHVAAYLADYPEQILINLTSSLSSPVTTAGYHNLGDDKPHPCRTKEWILSRIALILEEVDPDNVAEYMAAAKEYGLNGVDQPFWEDLPGYEPDLVICPDILHGLLRMWRDHILKWVRHLVGTTELDRRIRNLQPHVGMRHFKNGISSLSQWSGREDRELQRVLLAAIADTPCIDQHAMRCLRAFHDFLYLAQYCSHSTTTLGYLKQSLRVFHSLKKVFITNGARCGQKGNVIQHFCIPKLAGLHAYAYHIPRMGSSVQFSTEITETCHQSMAKAPYRATNGKDFFVQMCKYMNRQATIMLAEELGLWCFKRMKHDTNGNQAQGLTPDYHSFVRRMKAETKKEEKSELKQQNRAKNGYVWVTNKLDLRNADIEDTIRNYGLRQSIFADAFAKFMRKAGLDMSLTGLRVDAWYRCRVQRLQVQNDNELADARTIQAIPPSVTETRYGLCNCALVKDHSVVDVTGIKGYRLAQVRMIFQVRVAVTHPLHGVRLAFVYWFSTPPAATERDINMYKVHYRRDAEGLHIGGIVKLTHLCRLVQSVPVYGSVVNAELTAANSMDVCRDYYINSFMDKETYQAVW